MAETVKQSNRSAMKNLIILTVLLASVVQNARSQAQDSLKRATYGIDVNQFLTGSGFSSGTEILMSVTEGRRNFKIGFYFCPEAGRITGIIAHHEVALQRKYTMRRIQPYAFYNGIARITRLENEKLEISSSTVSGVYKSFEHHVGLGMRIKITRNIHLSAAAGYGLYFGSIKKPVMIMGLDEPAGGNGHSPIVKLGFGISL